MLESAECDCAAAQGRDDPYLWSLWKNGQRAELCRYTHVQGTLLHLTVDGVTLVRLLADTNDEVCRQCIRLKQQMSEGGWT
jgi:hypothetical protein